MTPARILRDDIELLGGLLGEVIRAQERAEAFALEERARTLSKALRSGDETAREQLSALVEGLSIDEATVLVRAFTSYFRLINLAEDSERVRRIHAHERKSFPSARRGSLREAIEIIADRGTGAAACRSCSRKLRSVSC